MMLGRCRHSVLVCDLGPPRNRKSHGLHGYLTRDGIPPPEFNDLGRRELTAYGVELRMVGVTDARKLADHYRRCDTNVPRLFVAGDASRDAQFVVVAAAEAVRAAVAINKALQS